jgi:hypothetical protein
VFHNPLPSCDDVHTLFDLVSLIIRCLYFLFANALLVSWAHCLVLGLLVLSSQIVKQECSMSGLLFLMASFGQKQDAASTFWAAAQRDRILSRQTCWHTTMNAWQNCCLFQIFTVKTISSYSLYHVDEDKTRKRWEMGCLLLVAICCWR